MRTIVTLTGPSASGKSTLENMLVNNGFAKVISTTTRPMRDGEINGKHYHFISKKEFEERDSNNQFVEKVEFGGNLYGVEVNEFKRCFAMNKPVVVVCEPDGANQIKRYASKNNWNVFSVCMTNDLETLFARYLSRLTKSSINADAHYHAKRMINISKERSWINNPIWDISVQYFNETNQDDIIGYIIDRVVAFEKYNISKYLDRTSIYA